MKRLINRRQQGDLGEASAIEWFTRAGAVVSTPLGHSPDYDLIADFGIGRYGSGQDKRLQGRALRSKFKMGCRRLHPRGQPELAGNREGS